ncbi:MAG TPA: hypothetical protein VJB59_01805 [Bdellovibrionota bacterium]|nr:hypothetical protein [Bdellovibrionota bacterium]
MFLRIPSVLLSLVVALGSAQPGFAYNWPSPTAVGPSSSPSVEPIKIPNGCQEQCNHFQSVKNSCEAVLASGLNCALQDSECCPARFQSSWGQVPPHCAALVGFEEASSAQQTMSIVYTSIAAVCLFACAYPFTGAPVGCFVGVTAATLADVAYSMAIGKATDAIAGGIVSAAGITAAVAIGTETLAGAAGAAAVGSNMAATSYALNPCVSGSIAAILAGLKWYSSSRSVRNADKECQAIESLLGPALGVATGDQPSNITPATGRGSDGAFYSARNSGGGTTRPETAADAILRTPPSQAGAATASNAPLLDKMPNYSQIPAELEKKGLSVGDIGQRLKTQSPGSLLASMGGMPAGFAGLMNQADKDIRDGKIQLLSGADNPGYVSGGSGATVPSGRSGEPLSFNFGSVTGAQNATGGSKEISLLPAAGIPGTSSEDIWHSSGKESIFQIISKRYVRNREKVSNEEWASPLNRALMGLPNRPAAQPGAKGNRK